MSDYPMKIEVVVQNEHELRSLYGFMAGNAPRPALNESEYCGVPMSEGGDLLRRQAVQDQVIDITAAADPDKLSAEKKTRKPREAKAPVEQAEPDKLNAETKDEVDLGDETPVKDYTDSELSQVANAAVQKLGSPDAVRKIIAQYTPAGETPHTRNIPASDRHSFVTFIEGLDAKAAASTDDF